MPARNVLWIMSDQHSWFASGCYGHPFVHTPNLDRLASEGLRFDAAYTPSPVCVPARFAAMCGRYAHRTGTENGAALPPRVRTAAHHFGSRLGHLTAFVGKMHPVDPQPHGFDFYVDMGHYYDYLGPRTEVFARGMDARNSGCGMPWMDSWYKQHSWRGEALRPGLPQVLPKEDHLEFFVARCCEQFLNRHGSEPFFLFASLLKPHWPFACPPEYHARYRPEDMPLPPNFDAHADVPPTVRQHFHPERSEAALREARTYIADYCAATTFMDEAVGEILNALERSGHADDTLVVYTTDHGEMLYQHALRGKFVFYEGSARVPLIVRAPGRPNAGRRTSALTDLTDLLPTSFAQCGGDPAELGCDGIDLSPVLARPEASVREACFSELGGRMMVREGSWKLAWYPADRDLPETWHLFDLAADPDEVRNLYEAEQHGARVQRMRERLRAWRSR